MIRRILAAIRRWAIDPELMDTLQQQERASAQAIAELRTNWVADDLYGGPPRPPRDPSP